MTRRPYRGARSVFWIVGSGSAHQGSTAAQRLRNRHGNPVVVHGLIHASWLNQIEIYFPIVPQKLLAPNDFTPLMDLPQRLMASSHHCNRIRLYETACKVGVKVWQRGERLARISRKKGHCCSVVRRIVAISCAYFLPRDGVVPEEPIRNRESACPKF